MSKAVMADCLEEARILLDKLDRDQGFIPDSLKFNGYDWVTVAVALYQERMRARRDALGEERQAEPVLPSTGTVGVTWKPGMHWSAFLCPSCSQEWGEGHVCPAAGSRSTARWPAP